MAKSRIPPTAPNMPPSPVTEPTTRFGNISPVRLKRFADHAWWAEAARVIRMAAVHLPCANAANATGKTQAAQRSIVTFLALFVDQPRFIRIPASQPPAILPTEETT